jgi:hypothetical protein
MSDDLGHVLIITAAAWYASPYGNLQKFYKNFLACTYEHTPQNLLYMQIPVLVVYNCGAIEHQVVLEQPVFLKHHLVSSMVLLINATVHVPHLLHIQRCCTAHDDCTHDGHNGDDALLHHYIVGASASVVKCALAYQGVASG